MSGANYYAPPQSPGPPRHQMTLQWTLDTAASTGVVGLSNRFQQLQQQQQQQNRRDSAGESSGLNATIEISDGDLAPESPLPMPADFVDNSADEACSLVDSTAWHENDLILAAELGKALLERNRDLELQLSGLRGLCEHQAQEIELLTRQVQTLRGLNDGKARMVEEVDKQCAELEARNRDLLAERVAARERAAALGKQCSSLEARVEELSQQLEQQNVAAAAAAVATAMKKATNADRIGSDRLDQLSDLRRLNRLKRPTMARTFSYPHLPPMSEDTTAVAARVALASTEAKNRRLLSELAAAEQEAELARQDCAQLRQQLREARQEHQQQQQQHRMQRLTPPHPNYRPLKDADEFEEFLQVGVDHFADHSCSGVGGDDLSSPIESDVQQIKGVADCGQLQSGGTVFSSRENLSKLGATKKLADTALAEISLLTELNDQYNRLVVEYEQLLAGKQARVSMAQAQSQTPCDEAGDLSKTAFEQKLSGIFAEETRSERKRLVNQDYRPKYKDLFRDAMSKLRDMKS